MSLLNALACSGRASRRRDGCWWHLYGRSTKLLQKVVTGKCDAQGLFAPEGEVMQSMGRLTQQNRDFHR